MFKYRMHYGVKKNAIGTNIIEILGKRGVLTAAEIYADLLRSRRSCSIQAVYQELRKLVRQGSVVRVKKRYLLRIAWVIDLRRKAMQMYKTALAPRNLSLLLTPDENNWKWTFPNLQDLVGFYTQLGLLLLGQSSGRILYEYVPHVWYHLAHNQYESSFLDSLATSGAKYFLVCRGNTPIDRMYSRTIRGEGIVVSYGHSPVPSNYKDQYVAVIDDLITSLSIDPNTLAALRNIFSARTIDLKAIYRAMNENAKIVVKLKHDRKKAEKLRRNFARFWGHK